MLVFKAQDLIPVIQDAIEYNCEILLVKDHGIYFMAQQGEKTPDGSTRHIAYAQGCHPDVDEFDDWWELCREELGGDDFVEYFPHDSPFFNDVITHGYDLNLIATHEHFNFQTTKLVDAN